MVDYNGARPGSKDDSASVQVKEFVGYSGSPPLCTEQELGIPKHEAREVH